MPIEVITILLPVPKDANQIQTKAIETANDTCVKMADTMRNSPMLKLDPNDGRKVVYTFTADVSFP